MQKNYNNDIEANILEFEALIYHEKNKNNDLYDTPIYMYMMYRNFVIVVCVTQIIENTGRTSCIASL